jgi:ribosome-associated heat shock protein Hsp15
MATGSTPRSTPPGAAGPGAGEKSEAGHGSAGGPPGGGSTGGGSAPVSAATSGPSGSGGTPGASGVETVRVDSWIWSVRLTKSRSQAANACRGGHVKVNNESVKPAHLLRVGDEVRVREGGFERVVVVKRLISKRVGPPVAAECYRDDSPPRPSREAMMAVGLRDRGAGRPTKRDRRELDRLFGRQ